MCTLYPYNVGYVRVYVENNKYEGMTFLSFYGQGLTQSSKFTKVFWIETFKAPSKSWILQQMHVDIQDLH